MPGTPSPLRSRLPTITHLVAGVLLLLLAATAHGAGPPRRADLYGDPLPPGAVARLGTMRLRHVYADLAFSKDGKQLISCGWDGVVRFWDAATGRLVRSRRLAWKAQEPGGHLDRVSLSPGGTIVAAAETFGRAAVYDTATGKELRRLPGSYKERLSFSADGKVLGAAGGGDIRIQLWDVARGKVRRVLKGPSLSKPFVLAFAPDGKRLALISKYLPDLDDVDEPGDFRLWDTTTGRTLGTKEDGMRGNSVAFSPDGKTLAVGFRGSVRFLDPASLKERRVLSSEAGGVNALAFSPDGRFLAGVSGSEYYGPPLEGKDVLIWDLKGRKTPRRLPTAGVRGRFAFSPDGKTLACPSSTFGSEIRLWDVPSGRQLLRRPGHGRAVEALAVSPGGKLIASDAEDGLYLWKASTGAPLHRLGRRACENRACLFSRDGKALVSAGPEGSLQAWDVATSKVLRRFKLDPPRGESGEVQAFGISADGKRLAAIFSVTVKDVPSGHLLVWDLATGKRLRQRPYQFEVRSMKDQASARLVPALRFVAAFDPPPRLPQVTGHAAFAPGAEVVSTWLGNRVGLEEVATGRLLAALPKGVGQPLVFSPDGRVVAAALLRPKYKDIPYYGDERTGVSLIETATGEEIVRLKVGDFGGLAFTPDGRALIVADRKRLRVWDADTGERLHSMAWPKGIRDPRGQVVVRSLAALPGGRAVTGTEAGEVLVWDLSPASWHAGRPARDPGRKELEALWSDLAGDAPKAHRALHALAGAPAKAVPLLRDRLRPAAPVDATRVKKLLAHLDHAEFAVREAATRELTDLRDRVEPRLRDALRARSSPEARRGLESLLAGPPRLPAQTRRALRAVTALERIGTPQARSLLEKLAGGADSRETRVAQAALQRLKGR